MPPDATGIEAVGLLPHTETLAFKNGGTPGGKNKKMGNEPKVDVDKQLRVDRDVLNRRILFKKATRPDTQEEEIRKKLMPLNKMGRLEEGKSTGNMVGDVKEKEEKQDDNGFRRPSTVLYKKELVMQNMQWKGVSKVGAGLVNYGNTCFLNSVLQCLLHTPPLANYLLTTNHKDTCRMAKKKAICAICELQDLCRSVFAGKRVVRPVGIATHLKTWGKHFRKGRQEDAHEFLRYFMDAMQKSCLEGMDKKMDIRIQETTLIHQMFGGYLCSSVTCTECGYASKTYEAALDMSLEIARGAQTVEEALKKFTAKEKLDGNNKYKCEKCQRKVVAVKQLQVLEAPLVLSLHLKRFDYLAFGGGKITKKIGFSEDLDLSPYMAKGGARYRLAGMIQHHGHSTHSGHYIAYVRAPAGQWYMMDDDEVHLVGAKSLLNAQAYMLFYMRTGTGSKPTSELPQKESPKPRENGTVNRVPPTVKTAAAGPTIIAAPKKPLKDVKNGIVGVSQKNGIEVKRKSSMEETEKSEKIREKKSEKPKVEDSAHKKWIVEKEDSDDDAGKPNRESGKSEVSSVKKSKKRDRLGGFRVVEDDEDVGMAVDSSVAAKIREETREDETGERKKKKKKKKKAKTETEDEDTKEGPREDATEELENKEEKKEKRKEHVNEEANENGVGEEERTEKKKKKKKEKSETPEKAEETRKRKTEDEEERIPKKLKMRENGNENQKPERLFDSDWHSQETWKVERVKKISASKANFGGVLTAGQGDTQKLGENVKTWDGEQNMIDSVAVESRIFQRRHKDDVEIDKGRVKKVKTKKEERKPRFNVFQMAAEKKRKGQPQNSNRSYSPPPQV